MIGHKGCSGLPFHTKLRLLSLFGTKIPPLGGERRDWFQPPAWSGSRPESLGDSSLAVTKTCSRRCAFRFGKNFVIPGLVPIWQNGERKCWSCGFDPQRDGQIFRWSGDHGHAVGARLSEFSAELSIASRISMGNALRRSSAWACSRKTFKRWMTC
jgi:hypothetical protein